MGFACSMGVDDGERQRQAARSMGAGSRSGLCL